MKNGWVQFEGRVLEVQPGGIRLQGWYTGNYRQADGDWAEFFVTNYPHAAAENELLTVDENQHLILVAKMAGVHSYRTVAGGTRTIRMLDYGQIYVPTAEEIEAAQKAAEAKREAEKAKAKEAAENALKMNLDLAAKGDAYGLLRMGERYRDGDGVEKDLAKAKDYLQKAAEKGSPTAADELKKLTDN